MNWNHYGVLGKIEVVDSKVCREETTMTNPLVRKVCIELKGGGPNDGERFELVEDELEVGRAPYIEFDLTENAETATAKNYVHIYAAPTPFTGGETAVVLEYAGWFNGLYDPFQESPEE